MVNNIYSRHKNTGMSIFSEKRGTDGGVRSKVHHKTYMIGKPQKEVLVSHAISARKFVAENLNREFDHLSVEGVEVSPDHTETKEMLLRDISEDGGLILVAFVDNKPSKAEWLETPTEAA